MPREACSRRACPRACLPRLALAIGLQISAERRMARQYSQLSADKSGVRPAGLRARSLPHSFCAELFHERLFASAAYDAAGGAGAARGIGELWRLWMLCRGREREVRY